MKLFISYRQDDTGGYCTDRCRMLQRSFGEENVFFDIKSIALGDERNPQPGPPPTFRTPPSTRRRST